MTKNNGHIALLLSVGILVFLLVDRINTGKQKIGIIQMEQLVYEYEGMKEATVLYEKKMDLWSNQTDSLEAQLTKLYQEIRMDSINQDQKKLLVDQKKFTMLQRSYYDFKQKAAQHAEKEDEEMTIGVINQLNEHIKTYAEKENYNIIISNTQFQNVSYVDNVIDITDQILTYANHNYQGDE